MPIIPPPPRPPKKETITVRLDLEMLNELRRYAVCLNSPNFSYIVACALKKLFDDDDWKKWVKAHPDIHLQTRGRPKGSKSHKTSQAPPNPPSASPMTTGEGPVASRNSVGGA
jgi:hypothetical protein